MKNIKKFELIADKNAAVLEEYSVSYVNEENKVYTTPKNSGQNGDTVKNYMRFIAVEDSQINLTSINPTTSEADNSVDLKHSKDGVTWAQYDFNPISLAAGETLYLKGNNENGFSNEGRVCTFGHASDMGMPNTPSTGKFKCHGNIMSLLYGDDFEDKTTIPSARCFIYLFDNCTSLTTAPELPATTLADYCYGAMFDSCTNLTTAPELPATKLADYCYNYMFFYCTSLTTAPELPATTLTMRCYDNMFYRCFSLTTAPELPATTLAMRCYDSMFSGCTSLTTAPSILPATTLADSCYKHMFQNCTSLTTAPELPATTLADSCYEEMFDSCTSLNHITMLATDISGGYYFTYWVYGVSPTGTFVKHPNMTSLETGTSGIPEGWTVENANI